MIQPVRPSRFSPPRPAASRSPVPAPPRSRGFSIVEIIVVLVILSVLAAAVVPRLAAMSGRQARADAEAVAELLSIAARRDELTSQRVALDFDAERGSLRLLTRRADAADWRPDPLAPDAQLRGSFLESVESEGVDLDPDRWRIEFQQSGRRPPVTLVVTDDRKRDSWRVTLPVGASRAALAPAASRLAPDGSIDLDAVGRSEEPW